MFGVNPLLWLLSAVNEVKTTRNEQNCERKVQREKKRRKRRRKKDSWQQYRTYCTTAVLNKKRSSIDLSVGNFSKHPAQLKKKKSRELPVMV